MESRTAPAFARPYVIFGFSYQREWADRLLQRLSARSPPVHRQADWSAHELCKPGGDRVISFDERG